MILSIFLYGFQYFLFLLSLSSTWDIGNRRVHLTPNMIGNLTNFTIHKQKSAGKEFSNYQMPLMLHTLTLNTHKITALTNNIIKACSVCESYTMNFRMGTGSPNLVVRVNSVPLTVVLSLNRGNHGRCECNVSSC
jgi:hypothetical protein